MKIIIENKILDIKKYINKNNFSLCNLEINIERENNLYFVEIMSFNKENKNIIDNYFNLKIRTIEEFENILNIIYQHDNNLELSQKEILLEVFNLLLSLLRKYEKIKLTIIIHNNIIIKINIKLNNNYINIVRNIKFDKNEILELGESIEKEIQNLIKYFEKKYKF